MTTGATTVETPAFLPIVNIMTGPPPIFQNGGIWKHIKKELFIGDRIDAFMSQILHFTDFNLKKKNLEIWFKETIPQRIEEQSGHRPYLFVDSGGYRLLYNANLNLKPFGFGSSVRDIMRLQAKFGGDAVATLDYPLPPNLNDFEARERIKKTIDNCLKTARHSREILGNEPLVYHCVHGRNRTEAFDTVRSLLKRLKSNGLHRARFGIAIGSLVPLSSSPKQVIEIVDGVVKGMEASDWIDAERVPVHAFGVSSRLMPILAAQGVDTFDGSSYVQGAQSLKYRVGNTFSAVSFYDIDELDCDCRYCTMLRKENLDTLKMHLRGAPGAKFEMNGEVTTKSRIYALIALHNLKASTDLTHLMRKAARSSRDLKTLLTATSVDPATRRNWAILARSSPEISDILWQIGVSSLRDGLDKGSEELPRKKRGAQRNSNLQPQIVRETSPNHVSISLSLRPDDFDIMRRKYEPKNSPFLIILPCSKQKPYSKSRSHRLVEKTLTGAGLNPADYVKVTISGNYGIVPEAYEEEPAIRQYDFYLNNNDKDRMNLLIDRTSRFIRKFGPRFDHILAYCTIKSYRAVLEKALDDIPNARILPNPLRIRKASQFGRPENLGQLSSVVKRLTNK